MIDHTYDLEYVPCNCCGADDTRLIAKAKEKWREVEYKIIQCKKCELIYVNPRRRGELNNDDNRNWDGALDYFRAREPDIRQGAITILDTLAASGYSKGNLLEIGSGMGCLLQEAGIRGMTVVGVEITRQLVTYCREMGFKVIGDSIDNAGLPESSYDIIVINHVLEHLLDPKGCLELIFRLLRPGGVVYIGIPGVDKRILRKAADDKDFADTLWRPEAHLYYFLPTVIRSMLRNAGFQELKVPCVGNIPRCWARKIIKEMLLHVSPGVFIARKPLL